MGTAPHVLLLNASLDESEMYAVWLEWCGYRVSVAQNLPSAQRVIRRETVDVLVIDAFFAASSRRDGSERRWVRLTNRDSLAVVVLSGYLLDANWPAGHGTRKVYLFKPCLPQQLTNCIEDLLSTPPHASIAGNTGKYLAGCLPS